MTWIGRKKLALVPVYRPNALPPDQIPPDWENDILRRIVCDRDPATGFDRSLRAYIQKVSSGQADLDAVVMPRVEVNQQEVPATILEAELGPRLREQGFDAAAIVMLGGRGAGTNAGFWSRFVMVEGLGIWAMEFMHGLTGFADLYPFGGDMDTFDQMAGSAGTHPSAYTKAAIGWLDSSAIALHNKRSAEYALHTLGLAQPPITARVAAVRIGSGVPYVLVEARERVDQFDAGIPSEGVIVYRVQTSDPLGKAQDMKPPLDLLTPTALKVGQAFKSDDGVAVQVVRQLPGGFSVRVEDTNSHVVDRSAEWGTPAAAGVPTACVISGLGVHNVAYRDTSGRLHELWRDAQGNTGTTDLTTNAGAPPASGNPFAYVDTSQNTEILLFRGGDGTVRSLYWSTGAVGHDDLGGTAGAPKSAGDPVGYYVPAADAHHVIYRTGDGHLHELNWTGVAPVSHGGNLTGAVSAPTAAGGPAAFVNGSGMNHVVYRGANGHILSVYWADGPSGLDDLSGVAGTPTAKGDPSAYYTPHDDTHQVVYLGADGHLWELYWQGAAPVVGWDLTAISGAPTAASRPSSYYSAGTHTKHVIYSSSDGHLHEIWWVPGGGTPAHVDITAAYGAPPAAERPAAFTVEGPNTQHVVYRGSDDHIHEVIW